jgi:hypothetical protein
MKSTLLLLASVALTGNVVAQSLTTQPATLTRVQTAPSVRQLQPLATQVNTDIKVRRNSVELSKFRAISPELAPKNFQVRNSLSAALQPAGNKSGKSVMSASNRAAFGELSSVQLSAASEGTLTGLDSVYYAVGTYEVGSNTQATTSWEMRVYPLSGDTVVLRNLIPFTASGWEDVQTQVKAIYSDGSLRVLPAQYVASAQRSSGDTYDIFLCEAMNPDQPFTLKVASDGSSLTLDDYSLLCYAIQLAGGNYTFNVDDDFEFFTLFDAVEYSNDASILNTIPATIYGKGQDYYTANTTTWETYYYTIDDATMAVYDLIPFSDYDEPVGAYATVSGSVVTISNEQPLLTYSNESGATYALCLVDLSKSTETTAVLSDISFQFDEEGAVVVPDGAIWVYWAAPYDADANTVDLTVDNGGIYEGYYNLDYSVEDWGSDIPVARGEAQDFMLHASFSEDFYIFGPYSFIAADRDLTFHSTTPAPYDSIGWAMNVYEYVWNGSSYEIQLVDTEISYDEDLNFTSGVGTFYTSPYLSVLNKGNFAAAYLWSLNYFSNYAPGNLFASGSESDLYYTSQSKQYYASTASYDNAYTFNLYSTNGEKASSVYSYQGKPASPIFFTGVKLFGASFACTDPKASLKLLIRHCHRNANGGIVPGDTIAIATATTADWKVGLQGTSLTYGNITFSDFFVENEYGFEEEYEGILNIEDEFLFELQGLDNAAITFYPMSEDNADVNGSLNTALAIASDPETLLYSQYANDRLYYAYEGFSMGYLYTEDEKSVRIPDEGGIASWTIYPGSYGEDDNGNPTTALWNADGYVEPDWVHVQIVSEDYTTNNDFVLQAAVDALPAGVSGRSCILKYMQWGASITLEILQGDATSGIESISAESRVYAATVVGDNIQVSCPSDVKNVTLYDATGARVATVPVVEGKAVIRGARTGLNIVNFGGKQSVKVIK